MDDFWDFEYDVWNKDVYDSVPNSYGALCEKLARDKHYFSPGELRILLIPHLTA